MKQLSFPNTKGVDDCFRYWILALFASAYLFLLLMVTICWGMQKTEARKMRVAVVQSVIENNLDQNRDKILNFIPQAKAEGCEVVIFPESSLYWSEISVDAPKKADIDAAIHQIGQKARSEGIYVIFGSQNKYTDDGAYHNLGIVYDADGKCLVSYVKNHEVPQAFLVNGVPFNLSVCSDRGYLEHSDLPCLAQGVQVIVDTSGGHGGDDGRPYLRLIRYRPWAVRTDAFVIVCNPPHEDTDFMGNSPWGGGSAIIRPDGTVQASLAYEKEFMIAEEIDLSLATRAEAERRGNNPILKPFWDMGKTLIDGGSIPSIPDITPYKSQEREIKIAAAQIACSRTMEDNIQKIKERIQQAAHQGADVVVFPELAATGSRKEDIESADQEALDTALSQIKQEAEAEGIYVIVGMPYFVDGNRKNCAFAIGDDGGIKTRYEQLNATWTDTFQPGSSLKNMWFQLKGVHSIVTIGEDSKWAEIADLAANRGMYLHFHISYSADTSADEAILRRQQNLLMLTYAQYGAVVNAADPAGSPDPSSPASGISVIVSREGGHNRPAPDDLEHYLPYQTSVVKSAGSGETMIYATRTTTAGNNMDLMRNWRNRNRRNRAQKGWFDWIKFGAQMVENADENAHITHQFD